MPDSRSRVSAALIVIGNEILSGRTQDANIQFVAQRLGALGIRLTEVRIVADDDDAIVAAVNACRGAYDYVFTTGGIGPTHDDITAASIARAFGLPLERNAEAEALLRRHFEGRSVNEARLSMADMPKGARLVGNPVSLAPGFCVDNVYVLAGVPSIMRAMLIGLEGELRRGTPLAARAFAMFLPEGEIAGGLGALQARYGALEIGSYPFLREGRLGTTIVLRGADAGVLDTAAGELVALARALGAEPEEEEPA